MTVALDCIVERDGFSLAITATLQSGTVVAVLGPNGSGKSTLVRAIAGLQPVSSGTITIGLDLVDDADSTFVVPQRRSVGVVFQDYALFPHLSVLENVAFGPRSRGTGRSKARAGALTALGSVGVAELADRRPGSLSGGQAQRVALARALATSPAVLLLDEPMAALDIETRQAVRAELADQLAAFAGCTILVTHEPLDAMLLADRVIVLEAGRVVQDGTPAELAQRPATPYIAALMGVTLLRANAVDGELSLEGGAMLHCADHTMAGPVLVVVRPESVTLHRSRPEGSARNTWQGTVASLQAAHDRVRVHVDGTPAVIAAVTPAAVAEMGLGKGAAVWLSLKAVDLDVYPRPSPGRSRRQDQPGG